MFYTRLKHDPDRKRIAQNLIALKSRLAVEVPAKTANSTLLATWNIREFDSAAYGARSLECLYYIAEIMSHFDLIAVQEVREDLAALKKLIRILGDGQWDYIVSDVTEGKPGNRERMAFVYDRRSVSFSAIAGEIVMPPIEVKQGQKTLRYDPAEQLYRTPYLCGFRTGWTHLLLCTVHILYGEDTASNPKRVAEIDRIAQLLAARARERSDNANVILLGDFNIYRPEDVTMKALTDAGFHIHESLQQLPPSNTGSTARFYDQIAMRKTGQNLEMTGQAGVFDFFKTVYRLEDEALYQGQMGAAYHTTSKGKPRKDKTGYYKTYWRTHQMSDHLPMWVQLKTDFSQDYLSALSLD